MLDSDEDQYQQWLKRRQTVELPPGFADRVMSAIVDEPTPRADVDLPLPRLLTRICMSPWGQFAACCAALLIGAVPYVVFLAGSMAF